MPKPGKGGKKRFTSTKNNSGQVKFTITNFNGTEKQLTAFLRKQNKRFSSLRPHAQGQAFVVMVPKDMEDLFKTVNGTQDNGAIITVTSESAEGGVVSLKDAISRIVTECYKRSERAIYLNNLPGMLNQLGYTKQLDIIAYKKVFEKIAEKQPELSSIYIQN